MQIEAEEPEAIAKPAPVYVVQFRYLGGVSWWYVGRTGWLCVRFEDAEKFGSAELAQEFLSGIARHASGDALRVRKVA